MDNKHVYLPRHSLSIPNTILLASDLTPIEKLVLSEIIWLQDFNEKENKGKYYSYASNLYFKAVFGISIRQVSRIINNLSQMGYIKPLKYINGDFRHIAYNYQKCFERDIILGLKPKLK